MPEILATALAQPGLVWLAIAGFAAGIVRGFSGFGGGMVYLPIAGQILHPVAALVTITIIDLIGPLPNMPRAVKSAHPRDILRMLAGLVVALPLGLWVLTSVPPEVFRYSVSLISLALLVLLIRGWRYPGPMTPPVIYGTGVGAGFLFGAVGLPGPPAILIYMASPHPVATIRANLLLFIMGADIVMMAMLGLRGQLGWATLTLGLVITVPYFLGSTLGAWMFQPERERAYRIAAYVIISVSALSGLPLWD